MLCDLSQFACKGKSNVLHIEYKEGLPQWINAGATDAIFRAIVTATTGDSPTLVWKTPITIATQMEMTMVDAQQRIDTPRHLVKVILRSRPKFQGRSHLHVTF
jgi:hypothetical protein